jgi:hypothetical protein
MEDHATDNCRLGIHSDPDNSGMCIYCGLILDPEPGEDPNSFRRSHRWPDVPDAYREEFGKPKQK